MTPPADGGDAGKPPATSTYNVGGTVSGLLGTGLVLQNNAGDEIPVAKNGSFTFPTKLAAGAAFDVTIKTQPTAPTQTCVVSGGKGSVVAGDVTSVTVNCAADKFTVGGTVTGLSGSGLVLQNSAGDDLVVNANGSFAFATPVASGAAYAVTVKTQPSDPSQTCSVAAGTGSVGAANVQNVAITCVTNKYKVGGTVSGLSGAGLALQINGGETLPVDDDGSFTFPTALDSGSAYTVTISTQPSSPVQTCTVAGGTGTIGGADVTSIAVNCDTNKFAIGGSVSGLDGTGLVLQNNGGNDLSLSADGTFAFSAAIASGASYAITIKSQPTNPWQTCTMTNAAGTVDASPIANIAVTCTTNQYKVSGNVSGLAGTGLVLQNSAGDDLPINSDGGFTFPTMVASGTTYNVTVKSQPTGLSQTCNVVAGVGTIAGGDVGDVSIQCVTDSFTVGGQVNGLAGAGLVLKNNGADDLPISANGAFVFATPVLSGAPYDVTIASQPTNPSQTCSVVAGGGTVTNGNVFTAMINCTTDKFAVGGSVSGLVGTGLVLQNEGGDDITINGDGPFSFPTPVASGAAYSVSVKTQPTVPSQTCTVTNDTGSVGGGAVSNVSVACTTNKYTVGGSLSGLSSGQVVLTNNGGDDLTLGSNGSFNFTTPIASGAAYSVAVKTQPVGHFCTVTNANGTVGGGAVSSVDVQCTTFANASFEDNWTGWTFTRTADSNCNFAGVVSSGTTLNLNSVVTDYISNVSTTITYSSSALPATYTALAPATDGTKLGLIAISNCGSTITASRDVLFPANTTTFKVNVQYSSGAALDSSNQWASVQLLNTSNAVLATPWSIGTGSPTSAALATKSANVASLAGTTVRIRLNVLANINPLYVAFDAFKLE